MPKFSHMRRSEPPEIRALERQCQRGAPPLSLPGLLLGALVLAVFLAVTWIFVGVLGELVS